MRVNGDRGRISFWGTKEMLIATRDMSCLGQKVKAGQPIPTPDKWHPSSLQSNLNLGWVREATPEEEKRLAAHTQTAAEATNEQPPSGGCPEGAGPSRTLDAHSVTLKIGNTAITGADDSTIIIGEFDCRTCSKSFRSKRALSVHARSHR